MNCLIENGKTYQKSVGVLIYYGGGLLIFPGIGRTLLQGDFFFDINRTWTLNVLCFQRQLPRAIRKQDTIWESKPGDSRCWATWTAESESDDLGRLGQTATKNCPQFDQFNYDRTRQPHWKYGLDWFSKGHLVNYYHLQ